VVGADLAPTDVERIARLRRRFGSVTLVKFDPASYGATGPMATPPPAREGVLRIATAPFAATWDQAFARDRPRRRWVRPDAGAGRAGPDRAGRAGVGG
jgi:hypothetical protein